MVRAPTKYLTRRQRQQQLTMKTVAARSSGPKHMAERCGTVWQCAGARAEYTGSGNAKGGGRGRGNRTCITQQWGAELQPAPPVRQRERMFERRANEQIEETCQQMGMPRMRGRGGGGGAHCAMGLRGASEEDMVGKGNVPPRLSAPTGSWIPEGAVGEWRQGQGSLGKSGLGMAYGNGRCGYGLGELNLFPNIGAGGTRFRWGSGHGYQTKDHGQACATPQKPVGVGR